MKEAIFLSLKIAFISTIITSILGILTSRYIIKSKLKQKSILEVFFMLPMVLPPSLVGYILLIFIGRRGFLGKFLLNFDITLIFSPIAACLASIVVSFPLMYQSCKSAFLSVKEEYEDMAKTLGASELKIFFKILIPLATKGIAGGMLLSFARALGEFGATLMVAGNIPKKTQTIPIALYYAVENSDYDVANKLSFIIILISFFIIFFMNYVVFSKKGKKI